VHIVHVVQLYYPVPSGSIRYFSEIGKRLVAHGHQVTVLTTEAYDLEALWQTGRRTVDIPEEWHEGVRIVRFPVQRRGVHPLVYPVLRRLLVELGRLPLPVAWLRKFAAWTPQVPHIAQWLTDHHATIDIVHVTNVTLDGLIHPVMDVAERFGIPVLCTPFMHLGELHDPAFVRYYSMPQQIDVLQRSVCVFTMTQREAQFLQSRGVPADRCVVVGAGVNVADVTGGDAEAFRIQHDIPAGPVVLQVGAMARDKGTMTTIAAMQQLWQAGSSATLVLMGAPLQHFSDHVAQLPVDVRARIRVIAYASHTDIVNGYAAAQVFVLPSRTDSFGIVFLEAWCNHVPVIGANAGGIPDVITAEEDGLLVPFDAADALSQAINRCLNDPELSQRLGANGHTKVLHQHTWEHVFARVYAQYVAVEATCDVD
jgi:glycosyltransferase involved in cell wall biosynthesis